VTLSVSYLAALWMRVPVHPGDIVRWALDGDLPYLGESVEVQGYTTGKQSAAVAGGAGGVNAQDGGAGAGAGATRGGVGVGVGVGAGVSQTPHQQQQGQHGHAGSSFQRRLPFKHALSARTVPQAFLVASSAMFVAAKAGLGGAVQLKSVDL
jgi:hypothetical protein